MTTTLRSEVMRTIDLHGRNFASTIKDNDIVLIDFGDRVRCRLERSCRSLRFSLRIQSLAI
jgi:hypothetical protein